MTPFEAFDSRPKLTIARPAPPADPFEHIPRVPRAPRTPSNVGELGEQRDTEPASSISGDHLRHDSENTPPDGPFAIRQVLANLKKFDAGFEEMKTHCRAAAENSFATAESVRGLRIEMQDMKKEYDARFARLELERLWIPRLVSTASLVISIVALVFAIQHR